MTINIAGFEWDAGNEGKCRKHGVSCAEIEEVLRGAVRILPDVAHSGAEERFLAIGRTTAGRHVFMAFTLRRRNSQTFIRPISARYMHKKEIAHYEKENPEA